MKVAKLTKPVVDGLEPGDKPYVAWCGKEPGFGVAVRPTGVKTFIAQYDIGGRGGSTRRATLGRYGTNSGLRANTAGRFWRLTPLNAVTPRQHHIAFAS